MIPGPDDLSPEACDALALRAQAGDREAFSELVVALYPQLTGFLAFHAPSAELADEIAQATLVMAFERIADYQPRGTCAGWLKGIARNLLRRELSRRAHQRGGGSNRSWRSTRWRRSSRSPSRPPTRSSSNACAHASAGCRRGPG